MHYLLYVLNLSFLLAVAPGEAECFPWEYCRAALPVLFPAPVWFGKQVSLLLGWAAPRGSSRSGCSSCWQRWLGCAWCEQHARMAMLSEVTLRLSFVCIVPWINEASCVKETTVFQCFENIAALKVNLELNSIVDVWMLVVFSMVKNVLCEVLYAAW